MFGSFKSGSVAGTALLMVLLGPFLSVVRADDPADEALLKIQATHRNKVTGSRHLLAGLELTQPQARRLLAIAHQAAALYIEDIERQAELLPEMVEAFTEFAGEDSLGQGFSRSIERRTGRVNHEARIAREAILEKMLELEDQALAVLTAPQQEFATTFRLGKRALNLRKRFRKIAMRHNGQATRRGRRERDSGGDRLAAARRELDAITKQVNPRLGPVGQFLLHPAAFEPLCQITGTRPSDTMLRAIRVFENGLGTTPRTELEKQQAKVRKLRCEISNWNLINGLHLGLSQITQIVSAWEAYQAAQTTGSEQIRYRRGGRKGHRGDQDRAALERTVEGILNPGQRQVLADFSPCLIPPKNLKDPVRVGQANDFSRYEKWLKRIRRRGTDRIPKAIELILHEEAEHLGELPPTERRERAALLAETAREAVAMDAVDFELNKAELAERIKPRNRIKELRQKIDEMVRARGLPGRVSELVLNPTFIEQLKRRGRQLAQGVVPEPVDLAKGPQADNCAKGCAVKGKTGKKNRKKS